MSTRKYNVLTRACFLVAILSSVVYGKLGTLNWLALSVGGASAIVAIAAYFYNAQKLEEKDETEEDVPHAGVVPYEKTGVAMALGLVPEEQGENKITVTPAGEVQTTFWSNLRKPALKDRYVLLEYYQHVRQISRQTAQLSERQLFLDEIVQLVDRYSPTCEVEVSLADGHLTIRPARPSRPAHIKTREERQENDFKLPQAMPTSGLAN